MIISNENNENPSEEEELINSGLSLIDIKGNGETGLIKKLRNTLMAINENIWYLKLLEIMIHRYSKK